jgi:maltose alpha-D-glucosyltransferase/alpha-amylase
MIAVRKSHPVFGWGDFRWISSDSPAVAAYLRSTPDEKVLVVHNLGGDSHTVSLAVPGMASEPVNLISDILYPQAKDECISLSLEPFQYLWLKI